jgi:hypothetical protein
MNKLIIIWGFILKKFNISMLGIIGILVLVVFASGCTSNSNNTTTMSNSSSQSQSSQSNPTSNGSSSKYATVVVDYAGSFTGSISDGMGTRSVQGTGPQSFQLSQNPGNVGLSFQKKDNSTAPLTVSIHDINANTLTSNSTSASYGVVSLGYTF